MSEKSKRYYLLDSVRGFSVISMVLYHAMYDIVAIFGFDVSWYFKTPGHIWQQSICWVFIFISGVCWGMGKAPLKRGILFSLCGLVLTAATLIFMPSQLIIMGILSFMGAAYIVMIPFDKLVKKNAHIWLVITVLLFFITKNINSGYLGFENIILGRVWQGLYQIPAGFILGLPNAGFYSSDYFALMPWFFLFAAGHLFWICFGEKIKKSDIIYHDIPILGMVGRKSLLIYMLHQPVIMAVLTIFLTIS